MKKDFIPRYLVLLVETLRTRLRDPAFLARHRCRPQDFTRQRILTFELVMLLILQKTVKSIQRHLDALLDCLVAGAPRDPVTANACTQARAKLKASAFVELNTQCVLPVAYGPERAAEVRRWRGHRLIGFDSSLTLLPYSEALAQKYRVVQPTNQLGAVGMRYCEGRLSVAYDLLNRLGLDARLESGSVGEVRLAIEQLAHVQEADLVLSDQGFTGYVYLVHIRHGRKAHFAARCSPGSFAAAQELFRLNRGGESVITRVFAPPDKRAELRALGLPLEMTVRFVSVRLPDGSLEVLVSSLLQEQAYPTEEFAGLYHLRWGQETYHLVLKSRLDLENWSGERPEAIEQDFAATVLLCNLESLMTEPAQEQLNQKNPQVQNLRQVNRAQSFHTLKSHLVDMLLSSLPAEEVLARMQKFFVLAPVSVRPGRTATRQKPSLYRSYRFQRTKRKIVF